MRQQAVLYLGLVDLGHGNSRSYIYASDGSPGGTTLLSQAGALSDYLDLNPGFTDFRGFVLFEGYANGQYGLWETKGTAQSTIQLAATGSAADYNITVVGKKALFTGNAGSTLWVTDGTRPGTTELLSLGGGYHIDALGLLGGKVYFEAPDRNGRGIDLWVSDGTRSGTRELKAGAFDVITDDPDYLSLGDRMIFQAVDGRTGNTELYVTDGTAAGSRALLSDRNRVVETPSDFKRLNKTTAIFIADSGQLWTTNGTQSGTKELTDVEAKVGATPYDLVTTGGKAYFLDPQRNDNEAWALWVTDGTAAGTHELSRAFTVEVGTQYYYDADYGDKSTMLTAVDGKVYYTGQLGGLWVTDGTAAGTKELTDLTHPVDGAAVGDHFVFSDGQAVWETDGTVAGTKELADGPIDAGRFSSVDLPGLPPRHTVHAGTSDLYLQNGSEILDWSLHDGLYETVHTLSTKSSQNTIVGKGDFNGDKATDILVQSNAGTPTIYDWTLKHGVYDHTTRLGSFDDQTEKVAGTGDFFGDGTDDVLIQRGYPGVETISLGIWKMENGQRVGTTVVDGNTDGYLCVGTGDFNGDGTTDLLMQNGRRLEDWIMKNGHVEFAHVIAKNIGSDVVGPTGDFNGDGTTDVLLQNNRFLYDYSVHNGAVTSHITMSKHVPDYVAATGDYNGDGTTDIAFRGGSEDWTIKDGHVQATHFITAAGGYQLKA